MPPPKANKRYELHPHTLHKYFKMLLTAAGIPTEFIGFMMRHKTSTYLDVKMKGVDYLRKLYAASGITIVEKTITSRDTIYGIIEKIVQAKGYDVDKEIMQKAIIEPMATEMNLEKHRKAMLLDTLTEIIKNEVTDIPTCQNLKILTGE